MEPAIETESGAESVNTSASLPRAAALAGRTELEGEIERNPIFDALIGTDEDDVAGLVAYSIYKQNKRAWLDDFVKATGRGPTEAETRAYIIGESTERRLATYRRLAASTLAGEEPAGATRRRAQLSRAATGGLWAIAIVIALAVIGLAVHAGYFSGAK